MGGIELQEDTEGKRSIVITTSILLNYILFFCFGIEK